MGRRAVCWGGTIWSGAQGRLAVGGALALGMAAVGMGVPVAAEVVVEPPPAVPASLKTLPIPPVPDLDLYIRDMDAAIVLGKALFWDARAGSDGQACASCHFHAGADSRIKNQLTPGLLRVDPSGAPLPDTTFGNSDGAAASGNWVGPNYTLVADDFPFHQLVDPEDRNSAVAFDMNDAVASQGTFAGDFVTARRGAGDEDRCSRSADAVFNVHGIGVRKVEPRNTPSVVNAVFYHRNFWDGRARNEFNGINPFGRRSNLANPPDLANGESGIVVRGAGGRLERIQIELLNSSLASQAVGPPLSGFEMSCTGRVFADIGRKLLSRRPLSDQVVARNDSVLGPHRHAKGTGLDGTYADYVQKAFQHDYWAGVGNVDGYTQMEVNFSLFWGLAIQAYESTLVSDDSKYDRVQEGRAAFTASEANGLALFMGKGNCISCHAGPVFSGAAVDRRRNEIIERMFMAAGDGGGSGGVALYDGGFYNIGVRPSHEDPGVGASDPYGNPLSYTRQATQDPQRFVDPLEVDFSFFQTGLFEVPGRIVAGERDAVDGAFKVPSLRNVELTGPYFHNGGQATLRQVVDFYNRGGDSRRVAECAGTPGASDTSGLREACSNLAPDIMPLGLTDTEREDLVNFLLTLTDERVKFERAPFDHPSLEIPDGHPGDQFGVQPDEGKCRPALGPCPEDLARSDFLPLPAVGAKGRRVPIGTFLGLNPHQP